MAYACDRSGDAELAMMCPKWMPDSEEEVSSLMPLDQCRLQSPPVILSDTESAGTISLILAQASKISIVAASVSSSYSYSPSSTALDAAVFAEYPNSPLSLP